MPVRDELLSSAVYSSVVGDFRDVGAGRKRFLTGAREDDSTDG